jgi:hypothetical protein
LLLLRLRLRLHYFAAGVDRGGASVALPPPRHPWASLGDPKTKKVSNVTVWLRGRAVLDAVIDDLFSVCAA